MLLQHLGLYKNPVSFWGCIKTPYLSKLPKITLSLFPSYRFSQVSSLQTRIAIFPAFCGCESIRGRESTNVIFCFHFLSSPLILYSLPLVFLSCCICVLSFCIDFLTFCSHVLSCAVAKLVRCVSAQTRAFFFIFRYRFCYRLAIVLEACAGCHLQAS